jgi:hypothetical protein
MKRTVRFVENYMHLVAVIVKKKNKPIKDIKDPIDAIKFHPA